MTARRRWFLPETPDVLGLLRRQVAVTIEGVEAFEAWGAGEPGAADALRAAEQAGEVAKRELLSALRAAFVTPLEPEDLFALSRGVDRILNTALDLVSESIAMEAPPDETIATMARMLRIAVGQIDEALAALGSDDDAATASADAAIATARELGRVYYDGMAALLAVTDRTERIARRELYRGCSHLSEIVADVAERVVYAVVKQG